MPFAIGRVLSVAALGELLVRPWFRWDGPPGRRQSHMHDIMGVGLAPNCPDRSRCGTSRSGTRHGGDTDRQPALHATLQNGSALGTKQKELRRKDLVRAVEPRPSWQIILGLTASARDSAPHPLRSARDEPHPFKKTCRNYQPPLDNPHRSAAPCWVARIFSFSSLPIAVVIARNENNR